MLHDNTKRWQMLAALTVVVMLVALMAVLVGAQPAQAQDKRVPPTIVPTTSTVEGLTYSQWTVKWWQWAILPPYSASVWKDERGERCGLLQTGKVWFLAGVANTSGRVVRNCTTVVPAGTYLLVPLLNVEWDNEAVAAPGLEYGGLRDIATNIIDHTKDLYMNVDGWVIPISDNYRIKTPAWPPSHPDLYTMMATDNQYGLTCTGTDSPVCTDSSGAIVPFPGLKCEGYPGLCKAPFVGDGYYVMLAPLAPGNHTIRFGGAFYGDFNFNLDITYHITVK